MWHVVHSQVHPYVSLFMSFGEMTNSFHKNSLFQRYFYFKYIFSLSSHFHLYFIILTFLKKRSFLCIWSFIFNIGIIFNISRNIIRNIFIIWLYISEIFIFGSHFNMFIHDIFLAQHFEHKSIWCSVCYLIQRFFINYLLYVCTKIFEAISFCAITRH